MLHFFYFSDDILSNQHCQTLLDLFLSGITCVFSNTVFSSLLGHVLLFVPIWPESSCPFQTHNGLLGEYFVQPSRRTSDKPGKIHYMDKSVGTYLLIKEFRCFSQTHCHRYTKSSTQPCNLHLQTFVGRGNHSEGRGFLRKM